MNDNQTRKEPPEGGFFSSEKLTRELRFEAPVVSSESRTIELAFSSEAPVERSFGSEVLDHDAESVRLDRLNDGAAVLVNHDPDDVVGVVESARVDGDRMGRATIRFGNSARAQEIFQDVQDGIRRLVSVGYRINGYDITERSGDTDMVRVTDWTPYEISIVSIPADTNVGIGRTEETPVSEPIETKREEPEMDNSTVVESPLVETVPAFDVEAERSKVRTEEKRRTDAIRDIAGRYPGLEEASREAIESGESVDAFNARALEIIGEQNSKARAASQHDGEVDLSKKERKEYSLVRLMEAISNPKDNAAQRRAAFELEVSVEAQRNFGAGFNCRGEFVPTSLLTGERVMLAGASPATELVGTDHMASMYIDALRNSSSAMAAGVTYLSGLVGNVDIPRMVAGVTSTWISAEDGDATEDQATFDQVVLSPKDLACYTEVSRRLLQQSAPSIEGIVRSDLAIAQALGIDKAVLYGTGTSGQPTGIANQTGVGSATFAAAVPTYAELVDMVATVKGANYPVSSLTWLINAAMWGSMMTTPKQTTGNEGNFVMDVGTSTMVGHPVIVSEQVNDGDVILGDFSQVLLGEWGGLEINVDPYTHSLKGRVRYVTFKTVDVAVRHPEAFVVGNDGV